MKKVILIVGICLATWTFAATVSNVAVAPTGAGTGPVEITYDLDEAAVVTFDVTTNGVSIGQGAANAGGDANRYTLAGTGKRIFWMPHRDWEGFGLADVQVKVTAWSLDNPPPYMVAEIHGGDVQYYATADLIPDGGVTNRKYKTSHLAMRKVPAKDVIWTAGSRSGYASTAVREQMHRVKLSADFYVGVYAFTQGQFESTTNAGNKSATMSFANHELYPLTKYSLQKFRGALRGTSATPTDTSLLGVLRARTGLAFDLPNATQWEFACRAGAADNVNVSGAAIGDVAWHSGNWSGDPALSANAAHAVGQKLPNAFGLYDMQGNTMEASIDMIVTDNETSWRATFGSVVGTDTDGESIYGDPTVPTSTSSTAAIACMNGPYDNAPGDNSKNFSPARKAAGRTLTTDNDGLLGYRLVCPVANAGRLQ